MAQAVGIMRVHEYFHANPGSGLLRAGVRDNNPNCMIQTTQISYQKCAQDDVGKRYRNSCFFLKPNHGISQPEQNADEIQTPGRNIDRSLAVHFSPTSLFSKKMNRPHHPQRLFISCRFLFVQRRNL
jgi:hypothetical protein